MNEIKAVIFDMDGVIVESEYRNFLAKLEVLKPYNISFDTPNRRIYAQNRP